MQRRPRISHVSRVKKVQRHHRRGNAQQRLTEHHEAENQMRTSQLSNVDAVVEKVNSISSTRNLSVGIRKQPSVSVSVIRIPSLKAQSSIGDNHGSDFQNNSLQQLNMTSSHYDVQKAVVQSNRFDNIASNNMRPFSFTRRRQTIVPSNSFDFNDLKRFSTETNSSIPNFSARNDIWHKTSNASLIDRNNRMTNLINRDKERDNETRRRRRRGGCWIFCCSCCSPCCCLLTGISLTLLAAIIAALIGVLIITMANRTTSTTTTTTSSSTSTTTSATTTTTTSVTTTTSSTSTSSSTTSTSSSSTSTSSTSTTSTSSTSSTSTSSSSSTSTSSSSSSSTSSTSTSSSSSSSTSSTSTSSTSTSSTTSSSTSVTTVTTTTRTTTSVTTATTTTTKTTTTTASTVTITSNTCTAGWKGVTVLYHCTSCPNIVPYTQYTYTYTAISNRTRIAFAFREDEGCFALDAVSVRRLTAPTIELIGNNDFETGTLSSWTYCNPNSASSAGEVIPNSDNFQCMTSTYQAKSGSYFYYDGAVGNCDYLIQTFSTIVGQTYTISYWLYNRGNTAYPSSADVIISI
ncbi:unnamed protein product [Rotaria sordida]|uniref:Uncharacterized protein n=2 Tax=Rotaria sordida TaxID=392033 RepID=A0A813NQ47_9BILA|nr:unnamed protein product [Rotaria sordida]